MHYYVEKYRREYVKELRKIFPLPENLVLNLELELGLEGLSAVGPAHPNGDDLGVGQRLVDLNKGV